MCVEGQPSTARAHPSSVRTSTTFGWTPLREVFPRLGLLPSGAIATFSSIVRTPESSSGSTAGVRGSPGADVSQIWTAPATSRPKAASMPMMSSLRTRASFARRSRASPSGSSSAKKLRRSARPDAGGRGSSGTASESILLFIPQVRTASGVGLKSKSAPAPRRCPIMAP